ncbi:MAG: hypothetical protein AAB263_14820 [Planctomycetota bacterium]
MGLFGGKKKITEERHQPASEVPASARRSVRRVVPAARAQSNRTTQPSTAVTAAKKAPAVAVAVDDDVQLPGPDIVKAVAATPAALGNSPFITEPTPTRPASTRPILASAAPEFTGGLGQVRLGPSRTGDQVLLDFLTGKAGLLTPDQALAVREKALADGASLDETAVKLGLLTEQQLVDQLSQETWVPHLKVDKYEIRKKALDTITREDSLHFCVFPVDKLGSLLTLAMVNPLDVEAIRQLEQKTGLDIKKVVATRTEIAQAIDKYYGGKVIAVDGTRSFTQDAPAASGTATTVSPKAPEPIVQMPPALPPTAPTHPIANIPAIDISADIQDIDDLLGGEETIAPAIIEPISIKPEDVSEASELDDALIAPATVSIRNEPEFSLGDAPKSDTSALARQSSPAADASALEHTKHASIPPAPGAGSGARRAARGAISATARLVAGNAGPKVVSLVPVLEDEFRYAISHGKAHIFERWVALQSRNRIVNAVAVERELETVLSDLYSTTRKAS